MTTELQPSGYRDSNKCPPPPPPPALAPPGSYHRGGYNAGGEAYLKPRRSSPEEDRAPAKITDGYEQQQQVGGFPKKNAPGYKNDSGYSESIGFESFSLPLSERDASSPPPTPPVRDASSLKSVCYGPGHEKYPSWPSAPESRRYPDDGADEDVHSGSHRSKSWTDHTNYPKEKPAVYTRPHNKRPNATYTQQLKTVMERCEKIPAETFESRSSRNPGNPTEAELQSRMWPSVDREGKVLGDAEYNVPSPPERESKTLSPSDLEAYVRNYQEPTQVELYGDNDLSEGLEEYTTVQHSQQASYAQSEGYHSYVSSVDSTTTTPFLDRLRRDSEAVSARPMSSWEDGSSREGRDSVVTTSSGSASSSETLKWHGSMSDVSVSSGMPTSRSSGIGTQDRWHNGSMSDISSINGMPPPKSGVEEHDKWQDSMVGDHLGSVIDQHHHKKARSNRDSWQVSMNDRNKEQTDNNKWDNSMSKSFHAGMDRGVDQSNVDWENSIHSSMSDVSQSNGSGGGTGSKQLIAHSARVQTPQRHHSESVLYLDRERSQQRKLYPVSTSKLDDTHASRHQPPSPQQVQPSVAERISELEKQQSQQLAMRYTYLDPEKRHRVPDPTLKAIQKKALLSFYERHTSQGASWRSEPHLLAQNQNQQTTQQRNSPPPQPPPRPRPLSSRRASSASDYASGNWREKGAGNEKAGPQQQTSPTGNGSNSSSSSSSSSSSNSNGAIGNSNSGASDLPQPRHQHSNSCGSLSTDLIGPVIVGPAISIDDWVPERPPKKPHLRTAYSERLPSPDLPPPSPPTVTDVEVLNFDDPLPPPPPELSQSCTIESKVTPAERIENSFLTEAPCERIKERSSSCRRSTRKKVAPETSPTNSPPKTNSLSPNHEHQQHSFHFDYKSNTKVDPHSPMDNGFPVSRASARGRSSLRYPSTQKHALEDRLAPYSLATQMSDLMASKYSDSGHQRAAPQVPVTNSCREAEPKIKRQESFSQDSAHQSYLDRQKPRPQMPKNTSPITSGKNKYGQQQQRNFFGLPPKYADSQAPPAYEAVVSTVQTAPRHSPPPPPLAPRTPGKKLSPPPRPAPPAHGVHQGSQSKASYLAYRRERGAPDSEGSYKRTMSPNARLDDPVLLKVNHLNNNNNHTNNNRNNQRHELSKSQSSDALQSQQHRLDDHFSRKSVHNVSYSTETEKKRERLSPQSVEVLNDRNRQLERERRKLVAETRLVEDFYRDSTTTIEMTSQNVEMLNRRNEKQRLAAAVEARSPTTTSPKFSDRPSPPSTATESLDRKVSSPAQTDQTGSSWDRKTPSSSISSSPSRSSPSTKSSGSISPVDTSGLVPRSDVVLRVVNATTNDVASQTECSGIDERTRSDEETETLKPRKKLQEEIECEQLSRDLAEQLGPNDKLLPILVPAPEHKKSTDYVVDLFRIESSLQPRPRPRLSIEDPSAMDGLENESTEDDKKLESMPASPMSPSGKTSSPTSPRSPPCYTTSESKMRFLRRHLQNDGSNDEEQTSSTDAPAASSSTAATESVDLRQKKEELMVRLDKKLVVLRAEQEAVREEGELNEALGARVSSRISELARPAEASKYRLHVEEVGKITSLLLGLSGRLARAENALYDMPADHAERKSLESKRDKLIDQLEEAKILKNNIDRRSVNVSAIIAKYLNEEEFADYQHFITMKAKLIVDGREIQDKVKLGEEQLAALKEAIDL